MPNTDFVASFSSDQNFKATFSSNATFGLQLPDIVYTAGAKIYYDKTENWNKYTDLIPKRGDVYVYSDFAVQDGVEIPNLKIGDGDAYLADLPFVGMEFTQRLENHIADKESHITHAEREFWNSKVRCFLGKDDTENIIFTTL